MMRYKDLNLKSLREKCDIDFAHYTYIGGMCSCCHKPADFPAKYWRDNKVQSGANSSYILFKNANNGTGQVKSTDTICVPGSNRKWMMNPDYFYVVYIEHHLSDEQMEKVLKCLREQLDEDYHVIRPVDKYSCIEIRVTADMDAESYAREVRQ